MAIYDLVKKILQENPECRNSDKKLMWEVWIKTGFATRSHMNYGYFMNKACPTPESITRARRKLVNLFPEFDANTQVKAERDQKEKQKGTFIYREGKAYYV